MRYSHLPSTLQALLNTPDVFVEHDVPLHSFTSLRIGGTPLAFIQARTNEAIVTTIQTLDSATHEGQPKPIPFMVLGGGSNVVMPDGDLPFVVIELANRYIVEPASSSPDTPSDGIPPSAADTPSDSAALPVEGKSSDSPNTSSTAPGEHITITSGAGTSFDRLVNHCVENGYGNMAFFSGIPGSVGATPIQNVGAYGAEIADVLESITVYNRTTQTVYTMQPDELALQYRSSNLKYQTNIIVLDVTFRLHSDSSLYPVRFQELAASLGIIPGQSADAQAIRRGVLRLREQKGMVLSASDVDTHSAGSFFTNPIVTNEQTDYVRKQVTTLHGKEVSEAMPHFATEDGKVKLSAAWLIEKAGFHKGHSHQGAALSSKHTLAITNRGNATYNDVMGLANIIQTAVTQTFGVQLEIEPVVYSPTMTTE